MTIGFEQKIWRDESGKPGYYRFWVIGSQTITGGYVLGAAIKRFIMFVEAQHRSRP